MAITFAEPRKSTVYPAAAAILAMLLVAVAGHLMLPRAELVLPPVEGCRLERETCFADLPGGGRIFVLLEPRPLPSSMRMRLEVRPEGLRPASVEVEFRGVQMNMGLHRLVLARAGERFVGETVLPVCVSGRMLWQATVVVGLGRRNVAVPFLFESGA